MSIRGGEDGHHCPALGSGGAQAQRSMRTGQLARWAQLELFRISPRRYKCSQWHSLNGWRAACLGSCGGYAMNLACRSKFEEAGSGSPSYFTLTLMKD